MSNHKRKRKILYLSLLASCLVHGIAIYFVSRNHLDFLGSEEKEVISKVRIGAPIDLSCKVLFNELAFSTPRKKVILSSPTLEKPSLAFTPVFDPVEGMAEIPMETQNVLKEERAIVRASEIGFQFTPVDLAKTFQEMKESLKVIVAPIQGTYAFIKKKILGTKEEIVLPFCSENPFLLPDETPSSIELLHEDKSLHLDLISCPKETKAFSEIPLDFLSSLKKIQSTSLQNFFDVQVTRDHNEEGLFAITLIPKNEISQLKRLRQNYLFLIDKSHSIERRRFDMAKRAVINALGHLGKSNRFNIVTFSRDVNFLSEGWLTVSSKILKDARNFLKEQSPSGMLSSTNLFPVLQFVRRQSFLPQELTTIIMITDGNILSRSKNSQLLEQWTRTNPCQVSFYVCAVQGDKNLPLLDFYTSRNRGSVALAPGEKSLKRQVEKIIKKVSEPIASDVSLYARIKDDQKIYLSPSCHRIFPLYANEPLVIIGKAAEDLKNFDLFLQGKNGKEWLLLKKEIAISQAKEAEESLLSREWALYRSHLCYERYFREKNPAFLSNAKSILLPFGIPAALE